MNNASANSATQQAPSTASSSAMGASQTASRSVRLPGEDLSLNEMLRVMDVAREMRRNRDVAEEMFRRGEVRVELREKLMRSAQIAGDRVTNAEIDVAIDQYFATLNTYSDPKPGFQRFLAHTWVWRTRILAGAAALAIAMGGMYYFFLSANAPLSPTVQAERAVAAEQETAASLVERINAMTSDPVALGQAKSLQAEIFAASNSDITAAIAARQKLAEMVDQLAAAYEVRIVSNPGEPSVLERGMGDKDSIFYVIVEARDASGKVIPQTIRNAETGRVEKVTKWAEEVPREVYQRLRQDKASDGLLGETLFSVKTRGSLQPNVELPNNTGVPIMLGNRLTSW